MKALFCNYYFGFLFFFCFWQMILNYSFMLTLLNAPFVIIFSIFLQDNMITRLFKYTNKNPWLWAVYVVVIGLPVVLFISFCCTTSRSPVVVAAQKVLLLLFIYYLLPFHLIYLICKYFNLVYIVTAFTLNKNLCAVAVAKFSFTSF